MPTSAPLASPCTLPACWPATPLQLAPAAPSPPLAPLPQSDYELRLLGMRRGFDFDPGTNYRDALFLGDCDQGVRQLCTQLGWEAELEVLVTGGGEADA